MTQNHAPDAHAPHAHAHHDHDHDHDHDAHDHHGHAGGHGHHHHVPEGDRNLWIAVAINLGLTVAQLVGGILAGSLALIADALHNFSDAIALVLAFVARKVARRPADGAMTFGYARAEVVAALVNYTTLILIGLYLVYEAISRFFAPEPVAGWTVIWIAALALVIDLGTAALTWTLSKESVNIRAAFLHNISDALGSVGVIVAGILILVFGWTVVDPLVTLLIAGYILWQSFAEIGPVIRILMLGAPQDLDTTKVIAALESLDGIASVHHAHLWQMQEHEISLEAHVSIAPGAWDRCEAIKAAAKARLLDFGITHSTLELEAPGHHCDHQVVGHRPAAR